MKIKLLYILIAFYTITAEAQFNYVYNSSFEDYDLCPYAISQFHFLNSWINPSHATPDFYYDCVSFLSPTTTVGVPSNGQGFQYPHSGDGYAGFVPFNTDLPVGGDCNNPISSNYREYIQARLSNTLVAGKDYCISFWISLSEKSMYGIYSLGVYFSDTDDGYIYSNIYPATPQVVMENLPLNDTSGWQKVELSYTASGNERFMMIGNFKSIVETEYFVNNCNGSLRMAYYFIDDVSLTYGSCRNCYISTNNVTNSCENENNGQIDIVPCGGIAPYTFQWSNGANTEDVNDLAPGVYTVTVTGSKGCTGTTTIDVGSFFTPTITSYINNPGTTFLNAYEGDTILLNSGNNQSTSGVNYIWQSTEERGNSFGFIDPHMAETLAIPLENGVYDLKLTAIASNGCQEEDYLRVIVQGEYEGMPNAFSPNGDGINDYFRPLGLNYTEIIDFRVYNRWGQELYNNPNTSFGWDGTFQGAPQPMDVYIFVLLYKQEGQVSKMLKGEFSLIR